MRKTLQMIASPIAFCWGLVALAALEACKIPHYETVEALVFWGWFAAVALFSGQPVRKSA